MGSSPSDSDPTHIGPYEILDTLGSGGMGVVYLAQQKEPIRRRVAIKVIRLGMDSKQVLARFELERQALAVMSHSAIAKVYDAGMTEQGQPYFVMEQVEGVPIDEYCDTNKLSLPERIGVFQRVCDGVQHAHQKGVLHRDLKPGNILVSRKGDEHAVKIIDFGLARATDQQLVDNTIYTEQGQLIGTPEYMSPEQASGNAPDIDTRTDIYSLGVLLYELLTGELPFTSVELRHAGLMEIQRIIRDVDPEKPSTKITSRGDAASGWANKRRLSVGALRKTLRGDLDWIVMRAMAKEPVRRYASATNLAQERRRALENDGRAKAITRLEQARSALEAKVSRRRSFRFRNEADRFLHSTLSKLYRSEPPFELQPQMGVVPGRARGLQPTGTASRWAAVAARLFWLFGATRQPRRQLRQRRPHRALCLPLQQRSLAPRQQSGPAPRQGHHEMTAPHHDGSTHPR